MAPEASGPRIRALADAGIGLVALPATDLYLGGRGSTHDRPRGMAPIGIADRAGVVVALGSNNVQNAFTPYGSGALLPIAWLAGLVDQAGQPPRPVSPPRHDHGEPRAGCSVSPLPGLAVGAAAHLVIVDAEGPDDAVRGPAPVAAVLHAGVLVHEAARIAVRRGPVTTSVVAS